MKLRLFWVAMVLVTTAPMTRAIPVDIQGAGDWSNAQGSIHFSWAASDLFYFGGPLARSAFELSLDDGSRISGFLDGAWFSGWNLCFYAPHDSYRFGLLEGGTGFSLGVPSALNVSSHYSFTNGLPGEVEFVEEFNVAVTWDGERGSAAGTWRFNRCVPDGGSNILLLSASLLGLAGLRHVRRRRCRV